jgi:uridylate kinase
MASNLETRLFRLEQSIVQDEQKLATLAQQVAQLAQQLWAVAAMAGGGGGGGGGVFYFSPTAALSGPAGAPGTGSPTSLANQHIYAISGGAWSSVSTTATVSCGLPSGIVATKTCICIPNGDGTYSAIAQSCT